MRLDDGQIEVIDDTVAAILAAKTPAQRLAIAFGMWRYARGMTESFLRGQHPEWDETRLQREASRRISSGAV